MKQLYLFSLTLFSLFTSALFAQSPYASYPLDGNANDVSGNNYNGTITGNVTATNNRLFQPNKAMSFDGNGSYIQCPVSFDFPTRTILMWIYPMAFGGNYPENLAYNHDFPTIQNGLTSVGVVADGSCWNYLLMTCDQYRFSATPNLNEWYQCAIVRTPAEVRFYINGGLVYTGANPNGLHSGNGTSFPHIGSSRNSDQWFNGKIDDVLIYNAALNDSQIAANYARHITVYDTVHVTRYDTTTVSVSVADTLKFNVTLTGIAPPNNVNGLKVYPNPAKDHLVINNGNISSMTGYLIKITNSLGQLVFNQPVNQQQFNIDLNTWTGKGTYILYVLDTGQNVVGTKEIVLQ